jgi:hypothetical protein
LQDDDDVVVECKLEEEEPVFAIYVLRNPQGCFFWFNKENKKKNTKRKKKSNLCFQAPK